MSTVNYFGYGANRDPKMLSAILGVQEADLQGRGYPAVLEGYSLAVQRLGQVTDIRAEGMPVSPREVLASNWGDDFTSYVIRPHDEGMVTGTVWELTPEERERIRDWELIDLGWYEDYEAVVRTPEGGIVTIIGEKLRGDQPIDYEVDGLNYETWLNDPELIERIAIKVRHEYDARNGLANPEDSSPKRELKNS